MTVVASTPRIGRILEIAGLCALIVSAIGCHGNTQIAAKSPTPVRLADATLYGSPEGLRYSASIAPLAQASLSFKSSGYVTNIQQFIGADSARRNAGTADDGARGAVR